MSREKAQPEKKDPAKKQTLKTLRDPDYLWSMSCAIRPDESIHSLQVIPVTIFTAIVILFVRMYTYQRDMNDYFWSGGSSTLTEFFSHYKLVFIVISAVLALTLLTYRLFTQSLAIKRSHLYIPMLVYLVFVYLSLIFAANKDVAWLGWNDRFEGTLALTCYMVMLFYIINSINTEKNIKWVVYPLAVTTAILSLLGVSQALDRDFFRTAIGQKLIVPNVTAESGRTVWQMIDEAAARGEQLLSFTFQNREIYQTVYNINYVSFYLTLLIPLFGMLFIREKKRGKRVIWGLLFALIIFNLIGSASSGGLLGMFFVLVIGIIMLNKRILKWWKPILIILVITLAVGGITYQRWFPELSAAVRSVLGVDAPAAVPGDGGAENPQEVDRNTYRLDYFINDEMDIVFSIDGNEARLTTDPADPTRLSAADAAGEALQLETAAANADGTPIYRITDDRFDMVSLTPAQDENGRYFMIFQVDGQDRVWNFLLSDQGAFFLNDLGRTVKLKNVPHIGWESNPGFGSGRGYIWSRTLPMLKDTVLIGHGADTYCLYYPHQDYVGKYNAGWNVNMIVDKPHNMYLGIAVGTGVISLLTLLALWGIYLVQSVRLYWREKYDTFHSSVGFGIFLGICGFLVAGFVNDSTISVMPMFYGLLGIGIAINMMIIRERRAVAGTGVIKE